MTPHNQQNISKQQISNLAKIVADTWDDYIHATMHLGHGAPERYYRTWNAALENLIRALEHWKGN